jgi:hypothetical protein
MFFACGKTTRGGSNMKKRQNTGFKGAMTFFTYGSTEYALSDLHILHLERKCEYAACPDICR